MAFRPSFQQPPPRPPGVPGDPYPPPPGPPPVRPPTVLGLRGRQWMVVALVVGCCYLTTTVISFTGAWATLNREPTNAEL